MRFTALLTYLFLSMIALAQTSPHHSQDSLLTDTLQLSARIVFPLGRANIDTRLDNNSYELGKVNSTLGTIRNDTSYTLRHITISGFSSPEGPLALNRRLSRERIDSLKAYLSERINLPPGKIKAREWGEDWKGVEAFVLQCSDKQLPHRAQLLNIIRLHWPDEVKERQIRRRYPQDFQYLMRHCMPFLRRAELSLNFLYARVHNASVSASVCDGSLIAPPVDTIAPSVDTITSPVDTLPVIPCPSDHRFAVKTNLLYDAALIPNIGIEVYLGKRLSLTADWFYTWFSSDNRHRYWQGYGGYLGARYWFSPLISKDRPCSPFQFTGHHLGIYMLGMTYDVEWGGRGYQAAHFGFGGGVEYGYAFKLNRCLRLDLSIGVGFQDGEYKEYVPLDGHYVWDSTHKRHWWGPTKAEVSLVWVIK